MNYMLLATTFGNVTFLKSEGAQLLCYGASLLLYEQALSLKVILQVHNKRNYTVGQILLKDEVDTFILRMAV